MTACIMLLSSSMISARFPKSLWKIASRQICSRRGASAILAACSGEVEAKVCPSRDPIFFGLLCSTTITSTRSQQSGGAKEKAKEVSSDSPGNQSTNPPGIERQADPDPLLARRDNSCSTRSRPAAVVAASANAANPAAEDAIPVPIGKLRVLSTRACVSIPAFARTRSSSVETLARASSPASSWSMVNRSADRSGKKVTLVRASRAARLKEIEPFTGRLSVSSRLPQYLIRAMFGCAIAVAEFGLIFTS